MRPTLHLPSCLLIPCCQDEEKVRTIVTRLLGGFLSEKITYKVDTPPESLGNEKSIWEYYNEMASVLDNIREVEWRDLADTVLVFVCVPTHHDMCLLI